MKLLVRPFLITATRLGLFLAVVAWGLSQFWWLHINTPYLIADVLPGGYVVGFGYPNRSWDMAAMRVRKDAELAWVFKEPPREPYMNRPGLVSGFHKGGMTYANYNGFGHVSVRHWTVVSTVFVFNIVLQFVYRKRSLED